MSNKLATIALGVAIAALLVSSVVGVYYATTPGPTNGTQGLSGTNGTNGTNGHNGSAGSQGPPGGNGTNGRNGTNGTNGKNGTTFVTEWYSFAPKFNYTGTLTYLNISGMKCMSPGYGETICSFNVTNTCAPETTGITPAWACKNWYYALTNVSFNYTTQFYFVGSNPSLGYTLGWGTNITIELWFQTAIVGIFPSNDIPPIPILTPTINLGFGQVT